MLDKPIDEIVTDKDGKFSGVRSGKETVKGKQVIGDPSYFGAGQVAEGGKIRVVEEGKVVRAICLLKHPIPGTDDSDSVQIIVPQNQVNRRNGESHASHRCSSLLNEKLQTFILPWSHQLIMSVPRTSMSQLSAQLSRPKTQSKKSRLASIF